MHPALSEDGEYLYYASDHPDGWGGYDIYFSELVQDGWSEPRLLSRLINTVGDEMFPTIYGDTLFFSSDRLTGMGGLDIFKTYRINSKMWSPPYNLKPPINSGSDDFGFVVRQDRKGLDESVLASGYFTSNRLGAVGSDDIYRFEEVVPPVPEVPEVIDTTPVVYKLILKGFVLEKIYQNPDDPNSPILGRKPLEGARVDVRFGDENLLLTTSSDGIFTLELEEDQDYNFLASKAGFLTSQERFSTVGFGHNPNQPSQVFEIEIVLDKIFKNKEINLENIYYDFNKWDIRQDAKPTLAKLARALELNPKVQIQLSSHTDCRGNNRYNQVLSQRRAQSAVDYLIELGIDRNRLIARGLGEESPAVNCACSRCTEAEHQANRRTTFTILD